MSSGMSARTPRNLTLLAMPSERARAPRFPPAAAIPDRPAAARNRAGSRAPGRMRRAWWGNPSRSRIVPPPARQTSRPGLALAGVRRGPRAAAGKRPVSTPLGITFRRSPWYRPGGQIALGGSVTDDGGVIGQPVGEPIAEQSNPAAVEGAVDGRDEDRHSHQRSSTRSRSSWASWLCKMSGFQDRIRAASRNTHGAQARPAACRASRWGFPAGGPGDPWPQVRHEDAPGRPTSPGSASCHRENLLVGSAHPHAGGEDQHSHRSRSSEPPRVRRTMRFNRLGSRA